jgi:hypothetical protein
VSHKQKYFAEVVGDAATSISSALDRMVADLPKDEAPQEALACVVKNLAVMQPWFMRLIMEDPDIREAYDDAVASTPLKVKGK